MDHLTAKYLKKLVSQKICESNAPLFGVLDDRLYWSSEKSEIPVLEPVIKNSGASSILFSPPAEPYRSVIDYLCEYSSREGVIKPDDTETRTFLHDIPVVEEFTPERISDGLKRRKGIIIPGKGILTQGSMSPEQAFVIYSSICFSTFVKFMTDFYYHSKGLIKMNGDPEPVAVKAVRWYSETLSSAVTLPEARGPFSSGEDAIQAMAEAGSLTVSSGMVDSFFGNISVRIENTIYISQTGSSLDELAGCIDPCPMDNSTTNAITASSEFPAHRALYSTSNRKTILHGHPKFSVTMSMLCDDISCVNRGRCHIKCSKARHIKGIPVVPGEIGSGPYSLSKTMPAAMTGRGVIIWGHGLFTAGEEDFTDAYKNLLHIEKNCFNTYLDLTGC
ncbi:MAG TPA: class II aldolase/adducin family protein [Spirochaetota bacterium]|nr:class II aldolase/adducin family protein [Spirochaetota bacterium]HPJ33374.1 class II aldolase/adducin family protein [Spirochaetota bacterium]